MALARASRFCGNYAGRAEIHGFDLRTGKGFLTRDTWSGQSHASLKPPKGATSRQFAALGFAPFFATLLFDCRDVDPLF